MRQNVVSEQGHAISDSLLANPKKGTSLKFAFELTDERTRQCYPGVIFSWTSKGSLVGVFDSEVVSGSLT